MRSRWPPPRTNEAPVFPGRPIRRTQCGVGADDGCVTDTNGPRCDPLIAPPSPPRQGTHLRFSGVNPLSLLTFFAAAKKVSVPAPHRGDANKPITKQGKAQKARTRKGNAVGIQTTKK